MISTSLMCLTEFTEDNINYLVENGDFIHFDIMDEDFSTCFGVDIQYISELKKKYNANLDVHIMSYNPQKYIDYCISNNCDIISVHIESNINIDTFIKQVHSAGLKAGLCLCPNTKIEDIKKYLDKIDLINVMTVYPGPPGQKFLKAELFKVVQLSNLKKTNNYNFFVEIDGSCNEQNFFKMRSAGAEIFVVGKSGLFSLDNNLNVAWNKMLNYMNKEIIIYIHADFVGNPLKENIKNWLINHKYEVVDLYSDGNEEYPECAKKLSNIVIQNEYNIGLLFCGTGIGMSIAANKIKGVRAAVVFDVYSAKMAKEHNNANILCLGSRVVTEQRCYMIVEEFLNSKFLYGKHEPRVNRLDE